MYAVSRSNAAQRAIDHLPAHHRRAYDEIEYFLRLAFKGFLNDAELLRPAKIFGQNWLRYFDNVFPFIVYVEVGSADDYGEQTLLVHALLEATTRP